MSGERRSFMPVKKPRLCPACVEPLDVIVENGTLLYRWCQRCQRPWHSNELEMSCQRLDLHAEVAWLWHCPRGCRPIVCVPSVERGPVEPVQTLHKMFGAIPGLSADRVSLLELMPPCLSEQWRCAVCDRAWTPAQLRALSIANCEQCARVENGPFHHRTADQESAESKPMKKDSLDAFEQACMDTQIIANVACGVTAPLRLSFHGGVGAPADLRWWCAVPSNASAEAPVIQCHGATAWDAVEAMRAELVDRARGKADELATALAALNKALAR